MFFNLCVCVANEHCIIYLLYTIDLLNENMLISDSMCRNHDWSTNNICRIYWLWPVFLSCWNFLFVNWSNMWNRKHSFGRFLSQWLNVRNRKHPFIHRFEDWLWCKLSCGWWGLNSIWHSFNNWRVPNRRYGLAPDLIIKPYFILMIIYFIN